MSRAVEQGCGNGEEQRSENQHTQHYREDCIGRQSHQGIAKSLPLIPPVISVSGSLRSLLSLTLEENSIILCHAPSI